MKKIIFISFCILLLFQQCTLDKEDALAKAQKIYSDNTSDFNLLGMVCDSFTSKYPIDTLRISFRLNSQTLEIIQYSKGDEFISDVFNNNSVGLSKNELYDICYRNEIDMMYIRNGLLSMDISGLRSYGYELWMVYYKGNYCEWAKKRYEMEWCDKVKGDYYLKCEKDPD